MYTAQIVSLIHRIIQSKQIFTRFEYLSQLKRVGLVGTKISQRLTKKGVFFTNFFDFDSLSLTLALQLKFVRSAQNYGEW